MGVVEEGPGAIVRSEGTKRRSTLLDIYIHICVRSGLVMSVVVQVDLRASYHKF